jgi:nitrate reductase gamma subunit
VAIIFFILISLSSSSVYATEYYAFRLAGSDCTLCHTDPKTGSLNQTGASFQEEGYRYPFTWKGTFFYFLAGLAFFLIIFGFNLRFRLWHLGRSEGKWNQWKERWRGLVLYVFGHRTALRSFFPGISHLLLFGSLFILSLAVTIILVQEYFYFPLWRSRFIGSKTYPYLRLILDLFGMVGCAGTILLIFRRYLQRPKELDNQWTDAISLAFLFFIFLTGFSLTGIRNNKKEYQSFLTF